MQDGYVQPQITLLQQPASDVFPSDAAVFKVLLLNAANELGQYELFVPDLLFLALVQS
jgi:hypothetical protein